MGGTTAHREVSGGGHESEVRVGQTRRARGFAWCKDRNVGLGHAPGVRCLRHVYGVMSFRVQEFTAGACENVQTWPKRSS